MIEKSNSFGLLPPLALKLCAWVTLIAVISGCYFPVNNHSQVRTSQLRAAEQFGRASGNTLGTGSVRSGVSTVRPAWIMAPAYDSFIDSLADALFPR